MNESNENPENSLFYRWIRDFYIKFNRMNIATESFAIE